MSDATAEYFDVQEERSRRNRVMAVARQIHNDRQLHLMLLRIAPAERRSVYDALFPLLEFRPLNFKRLMRLSPLATNQRAN